MHKKRSRVLSIFLLILVVFGTFILTGLILFISITQTTLFWKTYTNKEYGFTFKYPPLLKIKDDGSFAHGYGVALDDIYIFSPYLHRTPLDITIYKNGTKEELYFANQLKVILKDGETEDYAYDNIKTWTSDNNNLYSYDLRYTGEILPAGGFPEKEAVGIRHGDFYYLSYDGSLLMPSSVFEKIISTFKFTN